MNISKLFAALSVSLLSCAAHAGVIEGGSTLLNNQGLTQLETWLGHGQLTLTNVFTKTQGSTSYNFHNAVDGKGATFVVLSASEDGTHWKTIGGYDPQSWRSTGGYNYNTDPTTWTAFMFNLTDSTKLVQTDPYQTYDASNYGPTFGGGHDLYVDSALSSGYSYGYSYGGYTYRSIVDGSGFDGVNMRIGALEVFTIAPYVPNAVPEPASVALLGMGLAGLAAARRKRVRKA